ncbi:helix-turn-helix domain-containing protein [Vibrio navarrensis]
MSPPYLFHALTVQTGSPITKLLLISLADLADHQGSCFPSYEYLATCCNVSVRSVKNHIKILQQQGHVKKVPRFAKGYQRSNLFQLQFCLAPNAHHSSHALAPPQALDSSQYQEESAAPISNKSNKTYLEQGSLQPAVITLLTLEGETAISQEFYQLLIETYPNLNIQQELQAMRMWLYLNEEKRRPRETLKFFINSWLRSAAKSRANRLQRMQSLSAGPTPTVPNPSVQNSPVQSRRPEILERCFTEYQQRRNKHPIEARIQAIVAEKKGR